MGVLGRRNDGPGPDLRTRDLEGDVLSSLRYPLGPGIPPAYEVEPVEPAFLPAQSTRRWTESVTPGSPVLKIIDVRTPSVLRFRTRADAVLADAVDNIILATAPKHDSPSSFADMIPWGCGRAFLHTPGQWWFSIAMVCAAARNLDLELVDASNPAVVPFLLGQRNGVQATYTTFTLASNTNQRVLSANQLVERVCVVVTNRDTTAGIQVAQGRSANTNGLAEGDFTAGAQNGDRIVIQGPELTLSSIQAAFPGTPGPTSNVMALAVIT